MPTAVKERHQKIDDEVAEVLRSRVTCTGNQLVITGPRLDPALYKKVDRALRLLGGKWTGGKTQAHVFVDSPKAIIAAAVGAGKVLDRKKTYQLFQTPIELARRMVELADIQPGDAVLEPSAGRGNIACAILSAESGCILHLVEIDPEHTEVLMGIGANGVTIGDFLLEPADGEFFERIVMNPPFSGGQDVQHILHAYSMLAPGGRLVAIVSSSPFNNQDGRSQDFRDWLDAVNCTHVEELPAGTFKESGTEIAAKLIVVNRTA